MSRMMLCLCLAGLVFLPLASADEKPNASKPNGNRLTYLDEPCNPYYVHRDFPKLTTPMWVGEEGVEAVVILGIDDMRGHEKWEAYLRPILNRLKQIDGRAPVSIMTCTIDPKHPHLQQWLEEGLSLEVHTVDHPCPLLGGMKGKGVRDQGAGTGKDAKPDVVPLDSRLSALVWSKDTYDRCVDLLHEVPNNKPVCFRMPCCDSLNTLSPRFFTEIFAKTTGKGHFLQADSSVFNVFTSDDPALPRELVLEATNATRRAGGVSPLVNETMDDSSSTRGLTPPARQGSLRERFRKYIPADRFFANTIENYPYPYVIDRLCWEFPCVAPSDWSAQHLHKPHNPQTVEDWKAALDCTVIKRGVFCLVFHPHNWIKPEQINELIDHAVTKHGKKVKFLTFKEAVERLNKNVLGGTSLRRTKAFDAKLVRLLDINNDGHLDVVANKDWQSGESRIWNCSDLLPPGWCIEQLRWAPIFGHCNWGMLSTEGPTISGHFYERGWTARNPPRLPQIPRNAGRVAQQILRDVDGDHVCELIVIGLDRIAIASWDFARNSFREFDREVAVPFSKKLTEPTGDFEKNIPVPRSDVGLRFIDLNEDGHDDLVFSDETAFAIRLYEENTKNWTKVVVSQSRDQRDGGFELPPIVRADGSNNGFWVHSRNLVWMNEDTAKSKNLVERQSFDELLARRLGTPARPDGKSAPDEKKSENKKTENKKTEDRTGKSAHPPDDGPKSPEESLKLMQVKPGYRVELVAAEPLVRDPVAFDWGPDGKLWVAEMADYPLGVGPGEEADGEDALLRSPVAPRQESRRATDSPSPADSAKKANSRSADPVAERQGYKKGGGRVRILEDTDGDGKYDKSTVFLDKLNFPNGVMPWRDGVLISAAPDVLFARDTNGDNKADEVKVLLTGFGEGNQQHRVNGFSWGLDNMVHCANGDSGGQIKVIGIVREGEAPAEPTSDGNTPSKAKRLGGSLALPNGQPKIIDIRGRDFRWNPDTGEIDPTSGQTQFGRNRDDFGNWFGNNNSNPMYHFVLDDFYTRRNPHVAPPDPKKQVSITPGPSPVFPISRTLARFNDFAMANRFTSANSAMVYRDELLFVRSQSSVVSGGKPTQPTTDNGPLTTDPQHVFISEPVHNLVHHEVMRADGVTFTSHRPDDEQQSEFLASKDNWFRPTQIKTGPDGALYIADMYRQVIEHPQYIPPALQEKLDLRAGHDKGRIYRVVRDGQPLHKFKPLQLPKKDGEEGLLEVVWEIDHPNGWQRDMIHRLLYWKWTELRDAKSLLPSSIRADRIRELEFLTGIGMGMALPQGSDRVATRVQALAVLRALGVIREQDIREGLADQHPAVRRFAIELCETLKAPFPDPLFNQLSRMGRDADASVRMQFAYTLGHPKFASLGNELGKLLYRERDDKYLVAAAMSSIHVRNVASVVANFLESSVTDVNASRGATSPTLASTLLNLAATLGDDQALLSLIEYVVSGAATTEAQPAMLAQVLESLDRRGTSLGQLKGIAPQRLARAERQLTARIDAARAEISDFKSQISNLKSESHLKSEILDLKSATAIASLPLLGRVPDRRGDDAKLVGELLVPQAQVSVQTAAVATLARINHADSAAALLGGWRTFTPALRVQVLDALLSRAAWTDKLLDALEAKSIAPSDIDATRRQRLVAHSNAAIRSRAVKLLEVSVNADRQKLVAEFAARLKDANITGEAARGAEVFKKRCATCHKLKEIGTSVGPDLVSLTDKSTAALLTAILDPNKAVEAKFLAYTAVNKQGQLFSGLIAAETGNSITLMAADGKQHTLLRADLDEFISSGKSFMPEGLEKDVSPNELADVIAFVQSSGPPPKKFDGNQPEAVMSDANGGLRLLATNAEIYGKTLVFEPQFKNLGYWGSVDDRAIWTINVAKPGKHSIRMNYACDNSTAGNEVVFEVAEQSVKAKIVGTGSWENYQTAILGELDLPAGQHRLTVRATETLKNHLMDLKELRLVPE